MNESLRQSIDRDMRVMLRELARYAEPGLFVYVWENYDENEWDTALPPALDAFDDSGARLLPHTIDALKRLGQNVRLNDREKIVLERVFSRAFPDSVY